MQAIIFDAKAILYAEPPQRQEGASPFYPGAIDTLYILAYWGFKVGTIMNTNMSSTQADEWLEQHGLHMEFAALVTAADVGANTPDPRSLQMAMERCQATPGESLYVSRDLVALARAQAAGLQTVYVGQEENVVANASIQQIFELLILPLLRTPGSPSAVPEILPAHRRPQIPAPATLQSLLAHVLWIGGAPDAGKTTITQWLAEKYGLQSYHYDPHETDHLLRLITDRTSQTYKWLSMTSEERWMLPTPEELLRDLLPGFGRRFRLVLEDLLTMPTSPPIIVEGFGILPELVQPLLTCPRQAVWLVPSKEFKWASFQARGKAKPRLDTSDPGRAMRNHFDRDMLLAQHTQEQAQALQLAWYGVDGTRSVEEMMALVEQHFAPLLPALVARPTLPATQLGQ